MAKIYKQSAYETISCLKPKFSTRVDNVTHQQKSFTFSNKLIPNKENNTIESSLLYSQGSDIYEIDFAVPLPKKTQDDPASDYGDGFKSVEGKPLSSKWAYQGETVAKMAYMGNGNESTLLAMSKNGSLAWFQENIKVPVHIVQEMMGPMTTYAAMHSYVRPDSLAVSDFALSLDAETVVKSQSNGSEEDSILKIIDNAGKPGDILRTIHVPGTTVTHTVRFFDNHFFASCSDDNTLRFWDTRTVSKPQFILCDPQNGGIRAFDASSVNTNLFATGFSTGVIKLWDVREVENATTDLTNRQNGEDPIQNEIANFYHRGGDSVVDIQFSFVAPYEVLTVGGSGHVYHWDMEYALSKFDENADNNEPQEASEELQTHSLKFVHTGGSRRNPKQQGKRNVTGWHPVIDNLVGAVDDDSLITVYKPYTIESSD